MLFYQNGFSRISAGRFIYTTQFSANAPEDTWQRIKKITGLQITS